MMSISKKPPPRWLKEVDQQFLLFTFEETYWHRKYTVTADAQRYFDWQIYWKSHFAIRTPEPTE